jgi:subtilisin family serine protease
MPLAATGVERFRRAHPTADGRGVLIAILDSGIDPGVEGLARTPTGDPKIVDLRDFSGEGRVALVRVAPRGDTVAVAGRRLAGFSRVRALDADGPWYAGALAELPLGDTVAADVNANGSVTDSLPVLVARATDGWVLLADTDGDGSLAGERPVHDFLVARETFGWTSTEEPPRLVLAANFSMERGEPLLDLHFDTSGHGTHVAGIAAGHDMYGVAGFDGVAPGAMLLGCKLADNAQGGITTTGSMIRALEYAVRFARARNLPLVVNLSFGVGNEIEGTARIDVLVDSVLAANPDVVMTISAGNEGPGLSTLGFPASAANAIAVGALFPGVFLAAPGGPPPADALADFSSRGGEVAGPHFVTPGVAYSTVPRWNRGGEREGGTSMASPHAAGLAALLVSAAAQSGWRPDARTLRQALMVTAQPLAGTATVDDGAGLADVNRAWAWLARRPALPPVVARGLASGDVNAAFVSLDGPSADTVRRFLLRGRPGSALPVRFRSTAPWLVAPRPVALGDSTIVSLVVRARAVRKPGVYTASISGWLPDTLLGPVVRIPVTVVVPHRGDFTVPAWTLPAGGWLRVPFVAERGRPFAVEVSGDEGSTALAYLHEPGGRAYRGQHALPLDSEEGAAMFDVETDEVEAGVYELVVQGSQLGATGITAEVRHSPLRVALAREGGLAVARLENVSRAEVAVQGLGGVIGAGRRESVGGRGGAPVRVPLEIPSWTRLLQVDVSMPPAAWSAFTDFGLTLFDSAGRQLEVEPLQTALGRLEHELSDSASLRRAELVLFPAFADASSAASWNLDVTVRYFADSTLRLEPSGTDAVRIGPGQEARMTFRLPDRTLPMPAPLVPLGFVAIRAGEDVWLTQALLEPEVAR